MEAVASLLAGGGIPQDIHVLDKAIKAANFLNAAKVLDPPYCPCCGGSISDPSRWSAPFVRTYADAPAMFCDVTVFIPKVLNTLLTHVGKLAAEAAAAPPTNPYALMFGMDDADSLPNQIRNLIQNIRNTEPALAERITRAVCGGDAVMWTSPAGAYTTAVGNAYLKSIAAKIAGGALVLSPDGTAERVNGVEVESLALQHMLAGKIEKAEFSNANNLVRAAAAADDDDDDEDGGTAAVPALLKGTVMKVMSVECELSPEERAYANAESLDELGSPAMKTVTLKVGCTLSVAAGAATCGGTLTLTAPEPNWYPDVDVPDFFNNRDDIRPTLHFEADVHDGGAPVSEGEMAALNGPGKDEYGRFGHDYDDDDDDDRLYKAFVDADRTISSGMLASMNCEKYPLFIVLATVLMDSIWTSSD